MRICLDISQIVYKGSGVARFTDGLVRSICAYDQKNEWVFFFSSLRRSLDKQIEEIIASKHFKLVKYKFPPSVLSLLWNDIHLFPIDAFVGKLDWYISSDWSESPSKIKKATIIHDLSYLRYPETVDKTIQHAQKARMKWVKKESDVIFTDSDMTRHDATTLLGIDDKRLYVNYPGVIEKNSFWKENTRGKKYILTVGKREPRKNLDRLVEAFSALQHPDIELYIVGAEGWGNVSIPPARNVKLLGYVSDEELARLYKNCQCFIYPSIWEGFGYPVVEAMSYGTPVLTSRTSSLGEIADNAALLFDPLDTSSIQEALGQAINNKELRQDLSKKGLRKSKRFTWERYFEKMISVLESNV